jgi:hypothetical protein
MLTTGWVARVEMMCGPEFEPGSAPLFEGWERETPDEVVPEYVPPDWSKPRTERMIRRVMVTVNTAAMEVTIVLMVSDVSLGLTMSQKSMLMALTSQMACERNCEELDACIEGMRLHRRG